MRLKISLLALALLTMGTLPAMGQSGSSSNKSKPSKKEDDYKPSNAAEISSQISKGIDAQGGTQFKSVPPIHDSPLGSKPDKKSKY